MSNAKNVCFLSKHLRTILKVVTIQTDVYAWIGKGSQRRAYMFKEYDDRLLQIGRFDV